MAVIRLLILFCFCSSVRPSLSLLHSKSSIFRVPAAIGINRSYLQPAVHRNPHQRMRRRFLQRTACELSVSRLGAALRPVMSPSPLGKFGTFFSVRNPIMSPLAEVQTTRGYPLNPAQAIFTTETLLLPQPEANLDPAQNNENRP